MARLGTFFLLFTMVSVSGELASATSAQKDLCSEEWPSEFESGRVELSYEIGENCEPINFIILNSDPEDEFDAAAMCLVQGKHVSMPSFESPFDASLPKAERVLTESEYRKLVQDFRDEHPEKFHERSIPVSLENESKGIVTCYFTEDWVRTGAEIVEGSAEPRNIDDFSVFPVQFYESNFVVEQ